MAVDTVIPDDFDPEFTGFDDPPLGRHHVLVTDVDEDGGRNGEMVVTYEILASSVENSEGVEFRDYFHKTTKAMKRIHIFAMAVGEVTAEQLKDMKARGASPQYDFSSCKGRHICVETEQHEHEGKNHVRVGFAIFHPNHPKVEKWRKHLAFMARLPGTKQGEAMPPAVKNAAAGSAATQQQQPPQATAPVPDILNGIV